MKLDIGKHLAAGQEADFCTGAVGGGGLAQGRQRLALAVFLFEQVAVAADHQLQRVRQRIHHRHAHPVQAAGYLVGVIVKLAAGMQRGHDHFRRRNTLFLMRANRYPPAVIGHGD